MGNPPNLHDSIALIASVESDAPITAANAGRPCGCDYRRGGRLLSVAALFTPVVRDTCSKYAIVERSPSSSSTRGVASRAAAARARCPGSAAAGRRRAAGLNVTRRPGARSGRPLCCASSRIENSAGLPRLTGSGEVVRRRHQADQRVDQVVDVAERARLPPIAEDRERAGRAAPARRSWTRRARRARACAGPYVLKMRATLMRTLVLAMSSRRTASRRSACPRRSRSATRSD